MFIAKKALFTLIICLPRSYNLISIQVDKIVLIN